MLLTIMDRLNISAVLPKEGSFEKLVVRTDIQEKIKITQDEIQKFNIKTIDKNIVWDVEGTTYTIDISFTNLEKSEIAMLLKKLSQEEKLSVDMVGIYKLFCCDEN